ncbi:MAG TPA: hypothetical protein VMV05_07700 [bacterium]|nr:hypothetical protein [bacterium]
MPELIAFRPKMGVSRLKKIAQAMDYPNVSRFIEDAILEKAQRGAHSTQHPGIQKLNDDIGKLIMKHLGIRWTKLDSKLDRELRREVDEVRSGKVKSYRWKGSLEQLFEDAKHHHYATAEDKSLLSSRK